MDNLNYQTVDAFVQAIADIVKETLKTMQNKSEQYMDGIVTAVASDNTTAAVDIGETSLSGLPNKTGEQLMKNDAVRIYSTTITNSDAYIGVKLS